jgi:glycoprotein 3-alpha-L-fucosyltransferase
MHLKDSFAQMKNIEEYKRPPHQIWLLFIIESPDNTVTFQSANNQINWTATYRHDSEIATPYYKYFPYFEHDSINNKSIENYSANKTKKVAWFVSNCGAKNLRLEYGKELQKYIQVDIYGRLVLF